MEIHSIFLAWLGGYTIWAVIGLFVLGLGAIICEMFIPGGIVGSIGVIFLIISIIMGFSIDVVTGMITLLLAFILGPILFAVGLKYMLISPIGKSLTQRKELSQKEGYVASEAGLENLLGKEGVVIGTLRPVGLAEIAGKRVDVISEGITITPGTRIKVTEIEGNRIVVAPIE